MMNRQAVLPIVAPILLAVLLFSGRPATAQWTTLDEALEPRVEGHSAIINGKIFTFGGFQTENITPTDQNEVYDPAEDDWSTFAPLPVPITHVGSALVGKKVWLVGGFALIGYTQTVDHVYIYDAEADSWTRGPSLPEVRAAGALVRLGRKLHYFSGLKNRNDDVGDHYVLDLDEPGGPKTWTTAAPLPNPRNHLSGVAVGGKIYAIGGQNNHDIDPVDTKLLHEYDPVTDTWTKKADLPSLRSHFEPGTFVVDGKIVLVGGKQGTNTCTDDITQYDPKTDTWADLFDMPDCLLAPSGKVIGDELFVSHGGKVNVYFPQTTLRKRSFSRSPSDELDFWPKDVSVALEAGESTKQESVLFTLTGEANYTVDTSDLPAWITSITGASGTADIPGAEIDVVLDATGLASGAYTHTLKANASGYQEAAWTIELVVSGGAAPQLALDPASIDLGPVPLGYTVRQDITITNTGNAGSNAPYSLDIGEDGAVDVRFGDGVQGQVPEPGQSVEASVYLTRTGAGTFDLPIDVQIGEQVVSSTISTEGVGTVIARINAGGGTLDETHQPGWVSDDFFEGGTSFQNAQANEIASVGTVPPDLYQSERSATSNLGSFGYAIPVPGPGTYVARLHFAETYFGAPGGTDDFVGRRVFDVNLEGGPVELEDYDIAAEVGPLTADARVFVVDVLDGVLNIDFDASADQPKVSGIEVFQTDPAVHQSFVAGWNLASLPASPADGAYQSVYDAIAIAQPPYVFANQAYQEAGTLSPGAGFWLNATAAGIQTHQGDRIDNVDHTLASGWQLVSPPSCLFPLSEAAGNTGLIAGPVYGYQRHLGYRVAEQLVPGRGYWVLSSGAGTVSFDCAQVSGAADKEAPGVVRPQATAQIATLRIQDASGVERTLLISDEAVSNPEQYLLPPLPPDGQADARFTTGSQLLAEEEGVIELQGMSTPLTLTLEGELSVTYTVDRLEAEEWLLEGVLDDGTPLEIQATDVTFLRLRIEEPGQSVGVETTALPEAFALHGVYPNPFAGQGALMFDLPADARVKVDVFSVLGQRVASFEAPMHAGRQRQMRLDGLDVPAGVYVYRLVAETTQGAAFQTGRFVVR